MKKILIVEDDEFLKGMESSKFTQSGFEVYSAENEAKTNELLATIVPNIILLDIMMEGNNGLVILEKIKSNDATKQIPVLVFSNLSDEETMKKALALGASEFLIKSNYTLAEIIEKVKAHTNS